MRYYWQSKGTSSYHDTVPVSEAFFPDEMWDLTPIVKKNSDANLCIIQCSQFPNFVAIHTCIQFSYCIKPAGI